MRTRRPRNDCFNCHKPHFSSEPHLEIQAVPGLCSQCHDFTADDFKKAHLGINPAEINCVSCHTPHSSKDPKLFKEKLHPPFESRDCGECHETEKKTDAKFKLKPGGRGPVCLGCHSDFEDKLKKPFVHTPVKIGECVGCHNPHTSANDKLLKADVSKVCLTCHKDILSGKAKSVHKPVLEGSCVKCHDPHSSDNKFNLLKAGNELCFGCHKDMANSVGNAKFKHNPVEKNCLNCHNPHESQTSDFLLKQEVPGLCKTCHRRRSPSSSSST